MSNTLKCPMCRTSKHTFLASVGYHRFYCERCKREFEDMDDSDIGYKRPDRRMIHQETAAKHRRERKAMKNLAETLA